MPRAVVGLVFLLGATGGVGNLAEAQVTDFHCSPVGGNAIRCEQRGRQRHEMEMQKRQHEREFEMERIRRGMK